MTTTERTKVLSVTVYLTIHVYMQKLSSGYYRPSSLRTNRGQQPRINPPTPIPTPYPLHLLTLLGANSRDTNLWRSRIWRLSLFRYPTPPPPPPKFNESHPRQIWEWLRTLHEVLHEVHTIKIRDTRFHGRKNLCQWLNGCKNAPKTIQRIRKTQVLS